MANDPLEGEAAQALFCAIADYVGLDKVQNYLDVKQWPTYKEFKKIHDTIIQEAWDKNKINGRTRIHGITLKRIEDFLIKDKTNSPSWYESSVYTAVKLITDINTINNNFKKIENAGWDDFFYVRGAKGASDNTMNNIGILFGAANKNDKLFGDINKWSPADIYFVSKKAREDIIEEVSALDKGTYNFISLNRLCNDLINDGELLPVSLKKAGKNVDIHLYNFVQKTNEARLSKVIFGAEGKHEPSHWKNTGAGAHTEGVGKTKKPKTRDYKIFFGDKNPPKDKLKFRHDPSSGTFGANKPIKCEIEVTGAKGRAGSAIYQGGGSVVDKLFKQVDPTLARNLATAYANGYKKYTKAVEQLNRNYDAKGIGNKNGTLTVKDMKTESHSTMTKATPKKNKYTEYKDERNILSATLLCAPVFNILYKWVVDNKKKETDFSGPITTLAQTFVKYATSMSPTSGKFVIAKSK